MMIKAIYRTGLCVLLACAMTACASSGSQTATIRDGQSLAFLGDSITNGGASYGGFCRLVVQGLKTKDVYVTPVMAGVSGNTSKDMLARLEADVLQYKPDWMVLAAGVNDIWHGDPTVKIGVFQPKPGMGVGLEDYIKNITAIVDRCTAAGTRVMLTTITPIREEPGFKLNQKAKAYNAFLMQLAEERGLPIATLNEQMFALIADGQRLTSDGVHPIQAGHDAMARGILRAFELDEAEVKTAQQEWDAALKILVVGDHQTTSGGRTGGWCHLLMDALNSGREMVTFNTYARYRGEATAKVLLQGAADKVEDAHRDLIFQAPLDDVRRGTPMAEYRQHIMAVVNLARENDLRAVLVTIPVQGNDPNGALSRQTQPYNDALRAVAQEMDVPLADIYNVMAKHHAADSNLKLTFDGERFNRQGAALMAQAVMGAMGREAMLTPHVRVMWAQRRYYNER